MKYKILMYDGHPVIWVKPSEIRLADLSFQTPILLDERMTMDQIEELMLKDTPAALKYDHALMIRKCDLVEVELKFTQEI